MLGKLLKIKMSSFLSALFGGTKYQKKSGSFWLLLGTAIFAALFGYGVIIEMLLEKVAEVFVAEGTEHIYFFLSGLFIFFVSVLVNLFMVQPQLYEAKDTNMLLSLPIKISSIVTSRMLSLLLFDGLITCILGIPAFFAYVNTGGIYSAQSVIIYFLSLLCMVISSLAVVCLIGWIVTKITMGRRYGNTGQMLLSTLFIVGSFAMTFVTFYALTMTQGIESDLVDGLRRIFFLINCFAVAVVNQSWSAFILFGVTAFLEFAIATTLIIHSFLKIVSVTQTHQKSGSKVIGYKQSSILSALVKKELKLIFSEKMYIVNAGMGAFLCLVFSVVLIVNRNIILLNIKDEAMIPGVLIVLLGIVNVINVFSAPSVSLEGESLWIPKSLPVDGASVLLSKALAHCSVCVPPTLVLAIVINVQFEMELIYRMFSFIFPLLIIAFMAVLGVLLNIKFPNFTFVNATAAVKQSVSVIVAMLCPAIGLGVLVLIYFILSNMIPLLLYLSIISVLFVLVDVFMYRYVAKYGQIMLLNLGESNDNN